ncbi:MAG: tail fiber domain-containing protein [bacterium]|nr:tail fiber domain-containing protein [bacterium]
MKKLILLCIIATSIPCWAIPHLINYQGYLTAPDGTPLDTTVAMNFRIYGMANGGDMLWMEAHPSVAVARGVFEVRLGSVTTLSDLFSDNRWLEIQIGNDLEMTPREQIVSVAHAYRAGTVDGAEGGSITGDINVTGKANIGVGNVNDGLFAFVAGASDTASGDYATIAGGYENIASDEYTTVAGGHYNKALASRATVSGGSSNVASGVVSTVGGGMQNEAGATFATVSGGFAGFATADYSTVSGGHSNWATAPHATVAGGRNNYAQGEHSSICGGLNNSVTGSGTFACGQNIDMVGNNSFIFSDGTYTGESGGGGDNRFIVVASGGSVIYSNSSISAGVRLNAGTNSWSSISDSTKKRCIRLCDTKSVLDKFALLPVKVWEYKSETEGTRHYGPMAQDFWNAFRLGTDSLGIETIDADGVLFAAVKELIDRNKVLEQRIEQLESALLQYGHNETNKSNRIE